MFRVNGEEVHNLTLLGKIVEANESSTSQQYTIDDGTGTVVVKKWVDADDAEGAKQTLAAGQYVRVYGHLRVFQGARNVIAFNMRPVTDFNEITYHFLEVVYCNSHNGARAAAAPKVEAGRRRGHRLRRSRRRRRRRGRDRHGLLQRSGHGHLQRSPGCHG